MSFIHTQTTLPTVELEVLNTDLGRFYRSPIEENRWYPSVTTVTGHAKKRFFQEWGKKEENKEILRHALERGNLLHKIIEEYLGNNLEYLDTLNLAQKRHFYQVKEDLDKISNIRGLEVPLWSDVLGLAGRVDCIAEFDGVLSIIDFKGSTKPKRESWIRNYFEQATAYSIMWQERTGERVDQVVIIMANDDGSNQLFVKKTKDFVPHLRETIVNYWKDILRGSIPTEHRVLLEQTKLELQKRGVLNGIDS